MARRRRSGRTRDASDIASPPLRSSPVYTWSPTPSTYLRLLEDRRQFFPDPVRPARAGRRASTQLVVPKKNDPSRKLSAGVQFKAPRDVAICVRRHTRREVLLARGLGGGRPRKRARWSEFSSVRCR